ncbi:MAG TPA: tyrosine-protein phosphatase [Candidatus Anoxymicrobiaceae bacterium]|jgi:protein-tyrosine phosphatase
MNRIPRRWVLSLVVLALAAAVLTPLAGCGTTTVRQTPASVHWVKLESVKNARDLGDWTLDDGSKIPYGRVFRSGKLSSATAADVAKLRSLGIRTSIDLRSKAEALISGKDPGAEQGFSGTTSAPMVGVASADGYKDIVNNQKSSIATAFRALADSSSYPVIIHCTAGKDRTGVVSALLLELLGVPRKQIVEEYLLSATTGSVSADWLEAALSEVDAAGGINKYLAGLGIDSSMQNAIKKNILGH